MKLTNKVSHSSLEASDSFRNVSLVVLFALLGLATFLGGEPRWTGEQFKIAVMVPGSTTTWGLSAFVISSVYLVGALMNPNKPDDEGTLRGWLMVIGAWSLALWSFALFWCIVQQMTINATDISWNGPFVWGWFAVMWALKGAAFFK